MATERIIGIDFGTSTSVIRVKRYKDGVPVSPSRLDVMPVKFSVSEDVAPTVIQITPEATYYGSNAMVRKRGEKVYTNFKVDLESEDPARRQQARELTADFFKYMYQAYNNDSLGGNLGDFDDTEKTIVSYPVKWSEETKQFMLDCAKKAGFKNVSGMDEASAAVHAALVRSEDSLRSNGYLIDGAPTNIMLVDMGAGTTDIVICRYTPGINPDFTILATWPLSGEGLFGGHETDDILRDYVMGLVPEDIRAKVQKRYDAMKFKAWKESTVSKQLKNNDTVKSYVALEEYVWDLDEEMDEIHIDRSRFETIAQDYLTVYVNMINESISAANLDNSQIDLVVLTGGHSQWYFADELLTDIRHIYLPKIQKDKKRIIRLIRPQETVAVGLVYTPIAVKYSQKPKQEPPKRRQDRVSAPKSKQTGPVDTSWMIYDTGKTVREIHTMPTNRKDIIKYYRRFGHHLITVSGNGVIYAIDAKGVLHSTGDPEVDKMTDVASVARTTYKCSPGVILTKKDGSVYTTSHTDVYEEKKKWTNIAVFSDCGGSALTFDGKVLGLREDSSGKAIEIRGDIGYHILYNDYHASNTTLTGIYALTGEEKTFLSRQGKIVSEYSFKLPKTFPSDTTLVSLNIMYDTYFAITEDGRLMTEHSPTGTAGPFDFSNWDDIVYVICRDRNESDRFFDGNKHAYFIGVTGKGRVKMKHYSVQYAVFRNKFKKCELIQDIDLGWQLF